MKILAISGALRKGSTNTGILRYAKSVAPSGVTIDVVPPLTTMYNGDLEEGGLPKDVLALADQVRDANALLFAIPEYNYSVAGPFKNTIDWLSRCNPPPLKGKTTAILGSGGFFGTCRAQLHFRQTAVFLQLRLLTTPEVFVQRWAEGGSVFDEKTGDLIRPDVQGRVQAIVAALVAEAKVPRVDQ